MRIGKLVALIMVPAALLLAPFTATYAQRPSFYFGGSWGAYSIEESDLDDNDDLLKGFIGVNFTPWFALEGQWTDFSSLEEDGGSSFEADGSGLAAVFSIPFGGGISSFFVKAGQFWWEADTVLGGLLTDEDGNDPFYGAGFKFGFNKHVSLRLEYERYDVADIDIDTASVGLQFTF